MLASVKKGDAKELAELMRQNPGFDVNMDQNGNGYTLLHHACDGNSRSAVIPLLVAHPDIDANVKNKYGGTPFYYACYGRPSCVREMLKDFRVKVNEPDKDGWTPLWWAAINDHLDVIKVWIASGREIDLGEPGDVDKTDAIRVAKKEGNTAVVTLLERFKECCKSTTPRSPLLQQGSSILSLGCPWNCKWCCASARWDQPRRSFRERTLRWLSSPWQGGFDSGSRVWAIPLSFILSFLYSLKPNPFSPSTLPLVHLLVPRNFFLSFFLSFFFFFFFTRKRRPG